MLRLRATFTSNAALHLRREILVARRNGASVFKGIGQGLTIRPCPSHVVACTGVMGASLNSARAFTTTSPVFSARRGPVGTLGGMLRSATTASATTSPSGVYTYLFWSGQRGMHTRGKETNKGTAEGQGAPKSEEAEEKEKAKPENDEEAKNKAEGEKSAEEEEAQGSDKEGKQKKKEKPKGRTIRDNINDFKEDIKKFPDIYNSANAVNFVVFTVFCLCSTGSNMEEQWWLKEWGLDNLFRPWNWLLHTFLTNNFLSMTYAMMLLHTLCHMVLPSLGSQGLFSYFAAVAIISGAIMWAGNRLYYGADAAPEKQFGPWDAVSGLFVLAYLMYGVSPVAVLNSFNSWIKYACWVGEICILYFDWQPTLVGAVVGVALCKGHPALRALIAKGGVK